jgi:hypothetical protein
MTGSMQRHRQNRPPPRHSNRLQPKAQHHAAHAQKPLHSRYGPNLDYRVLDNQAYAGPDDNGSAPGAQPEYVVAMMNRTELEAHQRLHRKKKKKTDGGASETRPAVSCAMVPP